MPRKARAAPGGYVYHVLNRGVGRRALFEKDADYAAFEAVLGRAREREPGVALLTYCLMPNHWHLVVRPREKPVPSRFLGDVAGRVEPRRRVSRTTGRCSSIRR